MKFTTITSAVLVAFAAVDAAVLPQEHHSRFLAEKDLLTAELAAWKASPVGCFAQANGLITTVGSTLDDLLDDQLVRFFLSKMTAEKAQRENPDATFGMNSPFSLMTENEFVKYVRKSSAGGQREFLRGLAQETTEAADAKKKPATNTTATTAFDWTTASNCVQAVKNQGQCGSCWAFASIGSIESAYCLKFGSLPPLLSEQQVTNCESRSTGCNGGVTAYALEYIQSNGGVCTASDYPYTSGDTGETGTCGSSCTKMPLSISSVASVSGTDAGFVFAIRKQPIAVSVAAGNPTWKQYTGGVVSSCETSELDHAVLAVGFDATSFKLKNQWSTWWGENGYIRLQRVSSTTAACNVINSYAVYPVVA